jgi:hypothetical protein
MRRMDCSMNLLKDSRRSVLGEALVNVSVLLLSAGAISDAYISFEMWTKVSVFSAGMVLLVVGVLICPNKDASEANKEAR